MIVYFKDCFLTITNQVEFTELPYAPRATRFKANVSIRIWRNGTNNRMMIPLIVEGETDLNCRDPYKMIKEFDQYYPYYSLSTRKKLETTYGITSYDIGGLTDAIMELEEDVLSVVKRAWYKIFDDDFDNDDSSSDSRITDSRRLPFGGKTIKTEFLNRDQEPITILLQTYYSKSKIIFGEIVLGHMQPSKEIYLFVEYNNGQILFQEDEYNRPETSLFAVCNALNVDKDVLLKEIRETCEKGRAAMTDEEKEWRIYDSDITNQDGSQYAEEMKKQFRLMKPSEARKLAFLLQCDMCKRFYTKGKLSEKDKDYFWNKELENPIEKHKNYGIPDKILAEIDENPKVFGEKINGYVRVCSLYTAEKYQGIGLGTDLLKNIQNKYKNIFLNVLVKNVDAILFYERLGLKKIATFIWSNGISTEQYYVMAYSKDGILSDLKEQLKSTNHYVLL